MKMTTPLKALDELIAEAVNNPEPCIIEITSLEDLLEMSGMGGGQVQVAGSVKARRKKR